jgi:major vault protein
LVEIARAGPELQAKLLSGLNLTGYILTEGNNPINLFNFANNLVKSDY